MIRSARPRKTADHCRDARPRDRIRLLLILKRIARQEGIEVDEVDVNRRIAEKAGDFGTSEKELKEELITAGGLDRLRDMLLAERTLEYLMEMDQ